MATPANQRSATLDEAHELEVELRVIDSGGQAQEHGSYSALLRSAGSAESLAADVARNKHEHLAAVYAPKSSGR